MASRGPHSMTDLQGTRRPIPNLRIAILAPLNLEFLAVRERLSNVEPHVSDEGLQYDVGQISLEDVTCDVAVVLCGQGSDRAGSTASDVVRMFNPRFLFLVGVAGSIKDARLGDVVIGDVIYDYTRSKEEETGNISIRSCNTHRVKSWIDQTASAVAREYLIGRQATSPSTNFRVFSGAIASGGSLIANIDGPTIKVLREHYSDTLAVEMEAAGFMTACHSRDKPALVVRGISDVIVGKEESDSTGGQERAAKNAADVCISIMGNI